MCRKTIKLTENQKKPHRKFRWKMIRAQKQAESSDEDENMHDCSLQIVLNWQDY